MRLASIYLTAFLIVGSPGASGHHDVAEVIETLTALIQSDRVDAAPDLYYRRATEYRVLHRLDEARADLERAIALDPDFVAAHEDLGRVHQILGRNDQAILCLDRAIGAATCPGERAASLALRAEIRSAGGQAEAALADCESAIAIAPGGSIDCFLLRADLQDELGLQARRAEGLLMGYRETKSVVLHDAWIDALIESGRFDTALPIVQENLAASRLKSSWLLRRARILQATGHRDAADADLNEALAELEARINPSAPDVTLLVDRGIAHSLLDDLPSARRDLAAAKTAGADHWATVQLEKALAVGKRTP